MPPRADLPFHPFDLAGAAAYLGVNAATVAGWLRSGWLLSLERGDVEAFREALDASWAEAGRRIV